MAQDPLDAEIAAFENLRPALEAENNGRWVVMTDGKIWKIFDSFHEAAIAGRKTFGQKTLLIRQVGAAPQRMPSSLLVEQPYIP